jgi:hypothetical protein
MQWQLIPSVVNQWFKPRSGQAKDYKLGKKKLIVNFSGTAACVFLLPH